MSQPSRAERRRSTRGGSAPPPKRDPMVPIYAGLAAVIILVFAGFSIVNAYQNHRQQAALAFEVSTPTPAPAPTRKPIQIKNFEVIGKPIGFAQPDVKKGILTDTAAGGRGSPVDGIPCETTEQAVLHIHSHLSIFNNGTPIEIPPYVGMAAMGQTGCLYWIHTHDATGIIHVEAGSDEAPNGGPYTLGMFFDIWGEPLGPLQVGPFKGQVTAFVNGTRYVGSLAQIPLRAHQDITLEVGTPIVPPPNYALPAGD
jgi:hypothetical protein